MLGNKQDYTYVLGYVSVVLNTSQRTCQAKIKILLMSGVMSLGCSTPGREPTLQAMNGIILILSCLLDSAVFTTSQRTHQTISLWLSLLSEKPLDGILQSVAEWVKIYCRWWMHAAGTNAPRWCAWQKKQPPKHCLAHLKASILKTKQTTKNKRKCCQQCLLLTTCL